MKQVTTRNGVTLETEERDEYEHADGLVNLLEAMLVAGLISLALLGAAALAAQAERAWRQWRGERAAAAATTAECLAENVRLGTYGDEMCGFITER